jgi:multidrug efflux pump subunit AcrA (membrane-fusion protein)
VPDLTRKGNVVSIAPTGTDIQGVTSYYTTIVLNEADPRLKDGLTASAEVVVDKRDNVLTVPNAAIQRSGTTGVVTVREQNGTQRQVQVELGLAGDAVTQIVSGLREGQQVVVAQKEE